MYTTVGKYPAFQSTVRYPDSANGQSTKKHNRYQLLYTYSIPPDDGLQICPKHVEVDSWFYLHRYIEMNGQQNVTNLLCTMQQF